VSKRDNPIYQGRDWFSYRWTVAQAFDALDHIHDLCLYTQGHDAPDGNADDLSPLPYLEDMCAVLGAHLSLLYADTIPTDQVQSRFTAKWQCFEARQTFDMLCENVAEITSTAEKDIQPIMTHTLALKEYIKKIDA